jgi:signal transduction histidine kinase/AraC-like DNA-binding protein/streptogramin lyase
MVWSRVVRDSLGFVWIGTLNGLERYDGYGIKEYRNVEQDPYSISSNMVRSLFCDSKNRLWLGTEATGICLYDRYLDRFFNFPLPPGDSISSQITLPRRFLEDRTGTLWFAAKGGIMRIHVPSRFGPNEFDSLARHIRFRPIPIVTPKTEAYDLCFRKDGKLVVGTDSGLFVLDPTTLRMSRPRFTDRLARRLDSLAVACLVLDPDGALWVATATEGLFRLDWERGTATNYRHREGDRESIRYDDILSMEMDSRGNLWVGSIKGFDLFSPAERRCIPYLTFGSAPGAGFRQAISVDNTGTLWFVAGNGVYWLSQRSLLLPHYSQQNANGWLRSFQTVERDRNGVIWCFSQGKLLKIDIPTMKIISTIDVLRGKTPDYSEIADRTSSLLDRHGNFWYAAWDLGLYKVNLTTQRVDTYNYRPFVGKSPSVRSIAQGSGDSLWIGTFYEGVFVFDPARATFTNCGIDTVSTGVTGISDGTIWISTVGEGLIVHNPSIGKTTRLVHNPSDPNSLSDDLARVVYEDPSGRIWVGAGSAINLWDPGKSVFRRYPNPAFEKPLFTVPIGSDPKGRLWIRNIPDGMSFLDPANSSFTNFNTSNGVCGSPSDIQVLDDGRLLLTGTAGVNIFHPDSLNYTRHPPSLVITQVVVNDSVVIPHAPVGSPGGLRLTHDQNVVELTFAAIDIDAPHLVKYEYRLIGLENNWVKPKDRRYVRYTALGPGDYTFVVKASSSWREWPAREISFAFTIAHPWWRTAWAYAIYVLFVTGLLFTMYRVRLQQIRLRQRIEMEHFRAEHLAEVDRLKSRFFANISHEFRTPLSLILGPIQKWKERAAQTHSPDLQFGENDNAVIVPKDEICQDLTMAERNAHRLLKLINQLLDLSKLEAGAMKLQASRMNIVPLVKGIAYSFESSAGLRGISLNVVAEREEIEVYCDRDMMEKILGNLLSNAFKFTPEGGSVTCTVGRHTIPSHDGEQEIVQITVIDTGIGIPQEELERVFDRFYQVDASQTREHEGSGIGLALAKELVELHHGTIHVQSEMGKGTEFTVRIPFGRSRLEDRQIVEVPLSDGSAALQVDPVVDDRAHEGVQAPTSSGQPDNDAPIVLVVDDNADVREYIRGYLTSTYQVLEAKDGAQGIAIALEVIPDLILCDVMMPKMDGKELCRVLKQDMRTSHIPVILLTARAGTDSRIEGLEIGADDYVTKPFESKELLARVRNLIEQRRQLRAKFSASVVLKPGEVAVTSIDVALLKQIMETVEKNMGNEDFGVDDLARGACLSRRHLNRKVHALTNLSPGEFIRYVRLQRARELLEKGAGSVAEIAFQVGFGNLSHFSASFRGRFGVLPSEVRGIQPHQ